MLLVVVCVSESACVQAGMCVCMCVCKCVCVSKGCNDLSFGPLPEVKRLLLHTHALGFLLTLAPSLFCKAPDSSDSTAEPSRGQELEVSLLLLSCVHIQHAVLSQCTEVSPSDAISTVPIWLLFLSAHSDTHKNPSLLIHLQWVLRKINLQLLFSEDGVGTVYSVR